VGQADLARTGPGAAAHQTDIARGVMGARKGRSRSSGVSGATIQSADRIVVVDESGVAEEGGHHELIAAGGIYRRLHTARFGTLIV
jgi:hypothetical protein